MTKYFEFSKRADNDNIVFPHVFQDEEDVLNRRTYKRYLHQDGNRGGSTAAGIATVSKSEKAKPIRRMG